MWYDRCLYRFIREIEKINFYLSIGGIAGAFMTGLFCQKWVNVDGGADGAFYGNPIQLWYQIAGILTSIGRKYLLIIEL